MGKRNYLIDGVSGSGKTAVAIELERRGFQAVHGDRTLAFVGDPETGLPMGHQAGSPSVQWKSDHWIWDVEKVKALCADQEKDMTFFCGGAMNAGKFIHVFDRVFVLQVDLKTSLRRIAERVLVDSTDFGATEEERELIVRRWATNSVSENAILVDTSRPVTLVVDEILSNC